MCPVESVSHSRKISDPVPKLHQGATNQVTGSRGRLPQASLRLRRLDEQVQDHAYATQLNANAVTKGMRLLRENGILRVVFGGSALEAVHRVAVLATHFV